MLFDYYSLFWLLYLSSMYWIYAFHILTSTYFSLPSVFVQKRFFCVTMLVTFGFESIISQKKHESYLPTAEAALQTCSLEKVFRKYAANLQGNTKTSVEKKSCSVERGDTLAKLVVLLKICLFGRDIELFWILIEGTNSEYPREIWYWWRFTYFSWDTKMFLCGNSLLSGKIWRTFLSLMDWQTSI